jgi:adenine-specific DNA-methyltransferase
LSRFRDKLEPGKGRKPCQYNWYEIQDNTAYYQEFEKEKVIWGLTADKWTFAYDDKGHYLPSNGYILTSSQVPIKVLLAVLNSHLMEYYFKFIGIMTAGGAFTLKHETVAEFPIKNVPVTKQKLLMNLVDQILALTKGEDYFSNAAKQAKVKELEHQIDQMVYELYGLTPEEIEVVEGHSFVR